MLQEVERELENLDTNVTSSSNLLQESKRESLSRETE